MEVFGILLAIFFWGIPLGLFGYFVYKVFGNKNNDHAETSTDRLSSIAFPSNIKFLLIATLLAYNVFAYEVVLGLGTGLFFASLVLVSYFAIHPANRTSLDQVIAFFGVFSSVFIGLRANGTVQGINALIAFLAIIALYMRVVAGYVDWRGVWLVKRAFDIVWNGIRNTFMLPMYQRIRGRDARINVWSAIKTLFFTLIVVYFFAEILSGADPVFAELIEDIKDELFARTFLSLFLLIVATVTLSIRLMPRNDERLEIAWLSFSEAFIPVLATEILFALFIFVQAKYLFGGHADLATFDLTYSEYVRKGFYELLVVAFFGSVLSYVLIVKERVIESVAKIQQLKVLNVVLVMELFFMLASALKRDLLYVDAYGLTRTRFIGGTFLLWLGIVLLLLLAMTVWQRTFSEKKFFAGIGIATVGMMLFFNIVNIDRYIALAEPPSDFDNPREYYYINSLSEDAVDGWEASVTYVEDSLDTLLMTPVSDLEQLIHNKLALIMLKEKRDALYAKYGTRDEAVTLLFPRYTKAVIPAPKNEDVAPVVYDDLYKSERGKIKRLQKWQSFNLSEYRAYQRIQENKGIFETKVNCMIREIEEFQYDNALDSYQLEYDIMYGVDRPFLVTSPRYYPKRYAEVDYGNDGIQVRSTLYSETDLRAPLAPVSISNQEYLTTCEE